MEYDDQRKQEMYDWFHKHFIPPDMCKPRMSKEHGYQYICGGPYFADDVIKEAYGDKHPKDIVAEVIADLDAEEHEWARSKFYDRDQ